mgnify:FL=1
MESEINNSGLCQCGCGKIAPLAPQTSAISGWIYGQPMKFIRGHNGRKKEIPYKIDSVSDCWNWVMGKTRNGYGRRWVNGKHAMAHRIIYEQLKGPIPEGLSLDHLCRNPSCVNPNHLESVTHTENVRRGANTKLNMQKANEIIELLKQGKSLRSIAKIYGVSPKIILLIKQRKIWKK